MKTKLISAVLAAALFGSAVSAAGMDMDVRPQNDGTTQSEQYVNKGTVFTTPSAEKLPITQDSETPEHMQLFARILS